MLGLNFKGSWRQYQKQVLDCFQDYQADGHVHLWLHQGLERQPLVSS